MKVSIVAHPDDEIIGVAGTILKHISNGDEVQILILCEGKSSRYDKLEDMDRSVLDKYYQETASAMKILQIDNYRICNVFIDISSFIDTKLEALSCYKSELREPPHPRNSDGENT